MDLFYLNDKLSKCMIIHKKNEKWGFKNCILINKLNK